MKKLVELGGLPYIVMRYHKDTWKTVVRQPHGGMGTEHIEVEGRWIDVSDLMREYNQKKYAGKGGIA